MKESITSVKQLSNLSPVNLVLYYSDNCSYCHMFKDHWSDIVTKVKQDMPIVKPLSIESRHFGDLGPMKFFNGVSGVPTISLIDNSGGFLKKFEGPRDSENIMSWLKTHTPKFNHKKTKKHRKRKTNKGRGRRRKQKTRRRKKRRKTKRTLILE
tara:strand:- start:233 stop:694 length:462 start_codon:yes stop_codon:yes gene_type:complete